MKPVEELIRKMTRVSNDINGNPRYVLHFFDFLSEEEIKDLRLSEGYKLAHERAKKVGFRKYMGKDFGGCFVGQSYNIKETAARILDLINNK